MNIEDFIFNYLDTGVFDGNYPEEEIILRKKRGQEKGTKKRGQIYFLAQ